MKSKILIGISQNVRFAVADTTYISKLAVDNSEYGNVIFCTSEIALLNIVSLLSSNIKSDSGEISLVLKGDGLLGNAHARAKSDGRIIATNTIKKEDLEKLNKCETIEEFKNVYTIGCGKLTFETDLGLKTPYYTEIDITQDKTIEDAISEYYAKSEQLDTIIKTGIKYGDSNDILKSGAIFIQKLPNASDEIFLKMKKKIEMIHGIQELLYHDFSLEKIVKLIFEDVSSDEGNLIEDYKILETRDLTFKCDCSREYCLDILKRVCSKEEIQSIIQENGYIETVCGFCKAAYRFKEVD